MTCTQLKLLLLDYSLFDYIEEFYSFYINNKLVADWRLIEKLIIRKYKLNLNNADSLKFYANLMNFGGFCDWKIFSTPNYEELLDFKFNLNSDKKIRIFLNNHYYVEQPKLFKYTIRTVFTEYDFLFRYSQLPKYKNKYYIIYRNL